MAYSDDTTRHEFSSDPDVLWSGTSRCEEKRCSEKIHVGGGNRMMYPGYWGYDDASALVH